MTVVADAVSRGHPGREGAALVVGLRADAVHEPVDAAQTMTFERRGHFADDPDTGGAPGELAVPGEVVDRYGDLDRAARGRAGAPRIDFGCRRRDGARRR